MRCPCCGKFMRYILTNADLTDEYYCDCLNEFVEDLLSQERNFDFIDKQNK